MSDAKSLGRIAYEAHWARAKDRYPGSYVVPWHLVGAFTAGLWEASANAVAAAVRREMSSNGDNAAFVMWSRE